MTELKSFCKKKNVKKSDLSSRSVSNLLCTSAKFSRLTLTGSKSLKKACTSIETYSVSYEEYVLEYSMYLLRKAQNRVLEQGKSSKKENVKKCLVSLKLEFEELIEKNLNLRKELVRLKSYIDIIRDTSTRIEKGKKLLEALRGSKFETSLKGLSDSMGNALNQLQLVDIDRKLIEEMFEKRVWGSGCELEECLKKIDSRTNKNKVQVLNIAEELKKLRQLSLENSIFKKRFASMFNSIYEEILETNYNSCINVVKKALTTREEKTEDLDLEFHIPELDQCTKGQELQHTLELSKLESYLMPKCSSTPQNENK